MYKQVLGNIKKDVQMMRKWAGREDFPREWMPELKYARLIN